MIDTLVKRYIAGLKRDWNKHGTSLTKTWVTNEGRKYIKISSGYNEDGKVVSESVNAFIDKNTFLRFIFTNIPSPPLLSGTS